MSIEVSEIDIQVIKPRNGLVAFVSFVYDKNIYLSSIGIHQKLGGGYRLTYPTKKVGNNEINMFHPINKQTSLLIEKAVVKKVMKVFNGKKETQTH